jgi:steroid 5-alpha reductase family enzyme
MISEQATALAVSAFILSLCMRGAASAATRKRNGGIADVVWTFAVGFVGACAALWPIGPGYAPSARQAVVAGLIVTWSLRLGCHLWRRNSRGPEDARYAELRQLWRADYPCRMMWFLQAQALAAVPLVAAVMLAGQRPGSFPDTFDLLGLCTLVAGLLGAWSADRTLSQFKAERRADGAICDRGLWGWSRHPNYFFEWIGWWAWPLIAFDPSGAYPQGLLAFAAPALMYYLLLHVSGVPPLEAHMEKSRGQAFAAYKERTPVFFPWPPTSS